MPPSLFALLPAGSALLTILGCLGGMLVYLTQSRKFADAERQRAAVEWQSVAEAHRERVEQLTGEVANLRLAQTELAAKMSSIEADRQFLLRANLDLQRRLQRATYRIGALEARMTAAAVPVPPPDDEEKIDAHA